MKVTVNRSGIPTVAVFATGTGFHLLLLWLSGRNPWGPHRFTLFDDAMISMDYARTFARTGELVWFPGAPRVQGFTNPLWTFAMALLHRVGLEGSAGALAVSMTGIILLALTAYLVRHTVLAVVGENGSWAATSAAGLVFVLYPTTYWTLRGMEVGLIAFLSLSLLCLVATDGADTRMRNILLVVTVCAGIFTRMDFALVGIGMSAIAWTTDRRTRDRSRIVLLATVGSVLATFVVQYSYYGHFLPNTYVLKMSGSSLAIRAARGFVTSAKIVPTILLVVSALFLTRNSGTGVRRLTMCSGCSFLLMCGYAVYVGGDAWENDVASRFHASVLPLALVTVASAAGSILPARRTGSTRLWMAFAIAAMAIIPVSLGTTQAVRQLRSHDILGTRTNLFVTATVLSLKTVVDPDATVATVWAGVPAYYGQWQMIDLLGKNDEFVAREPRRAPFFPGHDKWDYEHSVRDLRPDVVFQTFSRDPREDVSAKLRSWGYVRMCTGTGVSPRAAAWFRKASENVVWTGLVDCR